jgi:hypothetical protein
MNSITHGRLLKAQPFDRGRTDLHHVELFAEPCRLDLVCEISSGLFEIAPGLWHLEKSDWKGEMAAWRDRILHKRVVGQFENAESCIRASVVRDGQCRWWCLPLQ